MADRRYVAMALAGVSPLLLTMGGCAKPLDTDPNSADFAALCSGALSHYYVDGGKGPEYEAKSKRALYWRDRYYSVAGMSDDSAKRIIRIGYDLAYSHRKESIEGQNASMKEIMDRCAPYEKDAKPV